MHRVRPARRAIDSSLVTTAALLFVGVLLLAAGELGRSHLAFSAGLVITLAGVIVGVLQLVLYPDR